MTAKEKANELFSEFYFILFDSESDKGEEILISLLANKCALKHCELLIEMAPNYTIFYTEVRNKLKAL